jgi:hypothetical protein
MRTCIARVRIVRLRLRHDRLCLVSNRRRRGVRRRTCCLTRRLRRRSCRARAIDRRGRGADLVTGRGCRRADMLRRWRQAVMRGRRHGFAGAPLQRCRLRARRRTAACWGRVPCVWRHRKWWLRRRGLGCHGPLRIARPRNSCGRISVIRPRTTDG